MTSFFREEIYNRLPTANDVDENDNNACDADSFKTKMLSIFYSNRVLSQKQS